MRLGRQRLARHQLDRAGGTRPGRRAGRAPDRRRGRRWARCRTACPRRCRSPSPGPGRRDARRRRPRSMRYSLDQTTSGASVSVISTGTLRTPRREGAWPTGRRRAAARRCRRNGSVMTLKGVALSHLRRVAVDAAGAAHQRAGSTGTRCPRPARRRPAPGCRQPNITSGSMWPMTSARGDRRGMLGVEDAAFGRGDPDRRRASRRCSAPWAPRCT